MPESPWCLQREGRVQRAGKVAGGEPGEVGWEGHRCGHAQDLSSSQEQVAAVRKAHIPTRSAVLRLWSRLCSLLAALLPHLLDSFLALQPPKGSLLFLSLVPSSHPSICHQRQLSAWASGVLIRVSAPRPPGIFPLSSPQSSCCCDFPGLPVRATTAPACFDITRSPWQLSLS